MLTQLRRELNNATLRTTEVELLYKQTVVELQKKTKELEAAQTTIAELQKDLRCVPRVSRHRRHRAGARLCLSRCGSHGNPCVLVSRAAREAAASAGTPKLSEEQQQQMSFLKSVSLFHSFTEDQFFQTCSRLVVREFTPGAVIVRQRDVGDEFFIIQSGKVTTTTTLLLIASMTAHAAVPVVLQALRCQHHACSVSLFVCCRVSPRQPHTCARVCALQVTVRKKMERNRQRSDGSIDSSPSSPTFARKPRARL